MYFSDLQPGYGFMKTIGGTSYIISAGYHYSTGKGYVYTNLSGCSCFLPEYIEATGSSKTYDSTLNLAYTPVI